MAALACCNCERPAVCSCVCCFPLPLLCQEHRLSHSADSHFHLPANATRHVQNIESQTQLSERVINLRKQLSLINLYSDPQQQPSIDIRGLLMQFYENMGELKIQVNQFKADLSEEKKNEWNVEGTGDILTSLLWNENTESEFGTWVDIAHGLMLKDAFQYEESCRVLEGRWKLVQSNKGVEVLVLGLVVSEVMGLHIGRFDEALAVVEKSLEVANELSPKSEIALQLSNMKAALFINFSNPNQIQVFCVNTVLSFRDATTSEATFGTALYFYSTTYSPNRDHVEPEIMSQIEKWTAKTVDDSSNKVIEHIRLYLAAFRKLVDHEYQGAEGSLKSAEELARRYFPTSIYAALSWFMMFFLKFQAGQIRDLADVPDAEYLGTHFPATIFRTSILEFKAHIYNRMEDTVKEIEVRLSMNRKLQMNPKCELFIHNINALRLAYYNSGKKETAIDICESAYRILFERAFASPTFVELQSLLGYVYESEGQPQKKFEMYAETIRKLQATDPTNILFCEVLSTLAKWTEDTQKDNARQMCIELYLFLREKHPRCENYFRAVQTLGKMLKGMGQQEKVEEIALEAVQIAKTFYQFKGYANFINDFELDQFSKEIQLSILTETYEFLVSNPSSDYIDSARIIKQLFSDQPEKLLTILLEVYRTLLASPTNPALIEYLDALSSFYQNMNQFDKAIEMRLEAHQLLLNHLTCKNFLDNVEVLAMYYWNQNQRDKAIQFQVEMTKLLSAHPTCENYKKILILLTKNCKSERRLDIALEKYTEAYRLLQSATNPEHNWVVKPLCKLHVEMGNRDTAIQIAQQSLNSLRVLSPADCDNLCLLAGISRNSDYYEEVSNLYFNTILIYYENGYCDETNQFIHYFFEYLRSSEGKNKMIEIFLEIVSGLKKVNKQEMYKKSLDNILEFCRKDEWGTDENIRIRKKIIQFLLSCDPRDACLGNLLQQLGELLWDKRELEKSEACYFRSTRAELLRPSGYYQHNNTLEQNMRDLRLIFNGTDR